MYPSARQALATSSSQRMSLPPSPPAPPPDEAQLTATSVRSAFAVFAALLGIVLFLCVCTYLVHRTQPSPLKADGRSFRLTTRQRTPPAGSSSRSRTASLPAPASSPYASSPDGTPGSARKKRERRRFRLACLERARPWFASLGLAAAYRPAAPAAASASPNKTCTCMCASTTQVSATPSRRDEREPGEGRPGARASGQRAAGARRARLRREARREQGGAPFPSHPCPS